MPSDRPPSDDQPRSTPQEASSESERANSLTELFATAVELKSGARQQFLAELTMARPQLASELVSLLSASEEASQFLEDSPVERIRERAEPRRKGRGEERLGTLVGPYKLLEVIGHGGMGTVYRAERVDGGFSQVVALKLTRETLKGSEGPSDGPASRSLADRFLQERQILAQLDHPNIAKLLDGGLSDDQRPYFAMELVDGQPLIEACDGQTMTVLERVGLLEQACRAVQAAHSRLVVHRDIKPSNMMVDRGGRLKLLDFGIAKLLDPSATDSIIGDANHVTYVGLTPHTPGYAAPEQLRGEHATIATDVYSLGVVLYELLVGCRPEHSDASGQPRDPERPSTAVLRETDERSGEESKRAAESRARRSPESVAGARSTTPVQLSRQLSGDLEAIIGQALEPDPEDRYLTADALAQDLRRYREGLPVQARRPTVQYRLGKLVRRHRGVSVAIAAGLLALVVGLGASLWQAQVAAGERDRAQLEAAKAQQVQELLIEVFSQTDPDQTKGENLSPKELLDRSVEKVRAKLEQQPEARANLLDAMTRVYRAYSDLPRMEDAAREAVAIRRELEPEGSVALAKSLGLLASARYRQSHMAEGEALYQESVNMLRRLSAASALDLASALNGLAVTQSDQNKYAEAEAHHREALALRLAELGEDNGGVGVSRGNLGLVLMDMGRLAEAEELLRAAQATLESVHGLDSLVVANNRSFLAAALREAGKLDEAEAEFEAAQATYVQLLGAESAQAGRSLVSLASVAAVRGNFAEAERLTRESLKIQSQSLGANHINVGAAVMNVASYVSRQGRPQEALDLYQEGIDIRAQLGDRDMPTAAATSLRADLLRQLGRLGEAAIEADHGLQMLRRSLGDDHWRVAEGLVTKGRILEETEDLEGAGALYKEALGIQRNALGAEHERTGATLVLLGELDLQQGRTQAAHDLFGEAVSVLDAAKGTSDPWRGAALSGQGAARWRLGDHSPATRALLRDGHQILREASGDHDPWTRRAAERMPE